MQEIAFSLDNILISEEPEQEDKFPEYVRATKTDDKYLGKGIRFQMGYPFAMEPEHAKALGRWLINAAESFEND